MSIDDTLLRKVTENSERIAVILRKERCLLDGTDHHLLDKIVWLDLAAQQIPQLIVDVNNQLGSF